MFIHTYTIASVPAIWPIEIFEDIEFYGLFSFLLMSPFAPAGLAVTW